MSLTDHGQSNAGIFQLFSVRSAASQRNDFDMKLVTWQSARKQRQLLFCTGTVKSRNEKENVFHESAAGKDDDLRDELKRTPVDCMR